MTDDQPIETRVRRPIGRGAFILGALIAPLAPWTIFWTFCALMIAADDHVRMESSPLSVGELLLGGVGWIVVFVLPYAYGAMLLLGVPYVCWLERKGVSSWRTVSGGAAVIGAVVNLGIWVMMYGDFGLRAILFGGAIGFVTGLAFARIVGLFAAERK